MKLKSPVKLKDIAAIISANYTGDGESEVKGVNEIHKVEQGDLTFVDHEKYYGKALSSPATYIIINKEVGPPEGKGLIISDDPFRDYNKIVSHFSTPVAYQENKLRDSDISETAVLSPGVSIGTNVTIGSNSFIHPNVTIYNNVRIGSNVIIHANTVIGAEAFYYKRRKQLDTQYDKLLSCGKVIIDDDVEIGASCTIDKGVSGATIIGRGTKLDNQVHVGHGTLIGKNCLIAAQCGIAGKVVIEDEVTIWGQVGISKDLRIGKGATILAQSGVPKSLAGSKTYFGSPVTDARQKMKEIALMKILPEWFSKNG